MRIGLLLEQLDYGETYLDVFWKSSIAAAWDTGHHLLVMVGQYVLSDQVDEMAQAALFSLLDPAVFDGFVVCGTLLNLLPPERGADFVARLPRLPAIVTTKRLPGLAAATVDNEAGLRELLRHLIRGHGYRRIACVRGPAGHEEAEARYRVWRQEIEAAGLDESRGLVVDANFNHNKAPRLLEDFFALPGGLPQAVSVCSDEIALYLCDQLDARGIRVPEDVAVVGFDNVARTLYVKSPLSTVHQPIVETADLAFREVARAVEAGEPPRDIHLRSGMVLRRSCGCRERNPDLPEHLPRLEPAERAVETELRAAERSANGDLVVRAAIAHLHRKYWGVLDLLDDFNKLVRATAHMESIMDLPRALGRWLPELGIRRYCVSVCVSAQHQLDHFDCVAEAGEVLGPAPRRLLVLAAQPCLPGMVEGSTEFESRLLAPAGWLDAVAPVPLVCLPLTVGRRWHGLVLLEITGHDSIVYRSIQNHLATILDRESRLSQAMALAIREQTRAHGEQEKLQALSALVRGVAHEINTPIGIGITSTSFIKSQLEALVESLQGKGLSRSQLDDFILNSRNSNGLVERSLEKTAQLVKMFKEVAVSESIQERETFNLSAFLAQSAPIIAEDVRDCKLDLDLDLPPVETVVSHADAFWRILSQLLSNAAQHPAAGASRVRVRLGLAVSERYDDWLELSLEDDGAGIAEADLAHVFEPFFTTRRNNGHVGLGLHIVWNIVKYLLGGAISCASPPGGGSRFVVSFPRRSPPVGDADGL